jgi:predicted helicase
VTEIIEYLPPSSLAYKYEHEIHCNEVAILPYYIANLNIEFTYRQKMKEYKEFDNICFVDTLDNLGFLFDRKQLQLFDISDENLERIRRQNERKISVIIGNPPYNAHQVNENDNNKNREYQDIDKRIKETYIKSSTAQKTHLYDMYARFIRWASDRVDKNGIIAFVSNNSFIDSRTYDGFRKVVAEEFNEIYIVNMKGNARTSGERRRREAGNVFSDEIRVGVAIYFLVKREGATGCKIYYNAIADYTKSEDKKSYLQTNKLEKLPFIHILPDKKFNWVSQAENNWDVYIPLASKEAKFSPNIQHDHTIFRLFASAVKTNRDEWVIDINKKKLLTQIEFFADNFNNQIAGLKGKRDSEIDDELDYAIKWSDVLKKRAVTGAKLVYDENLVRKLTYRPFVNRWYYADKGLSDRLTSNHYSIYGKSLNQPNKIIAVNLDCPSFGVLATTNLLEFASLIFGSGSTQCLPLYRYTDDGRRVDNITDWAWREFQGHYGDPAITKEDIFYYVYAVLHHPAYREKYALNLKQEFPRIPYYADWQQWIAWGKALADLHVNFESVTPYPLERHDFSGSAALAPKPRLKPDKAKRLIEVDTATVLKNVPPEAWEYMLGNRSALEWVLERYKETTPKDPTIREKFNTYRFADYKEAAIILLQRVCTVSVETVKIIAAMPPT